MPPSTTFQTLAFPAVSPNPFHYRSHTCHFHIVNVNIQSAAAIPSSMLILEGENKNGKTKADQ
jgi:hypothetical protein